MRDGVVILGKPIDNSRLVRQVDPRSRTEIWLLILLVVALALGLGLYAWPAIEMRRVNQQQVELYRQKERLLEQKRKLQLERAALENLQRVEAIASRDLGLTAPRPEESIVVEVQKPLPRGSTIAKDETPAREARASVRGGRP